MGNANGREESSPGAEVAGGRADADGLGPVNDSSLASETSNVVSSDSMGNTPPGSPGNFRSPILFAPQVTFLFLLLLLLFPLFSLSCVYCVFQSFNDVVLKTIRFVIVGNLCVKIVVLQ